MSTQKRRKGAESGSESSENDEQKTKKTYNQKFKPSWTEEKDLKTWLVKSSVSGIARCKICEADLKGSITQIRRHAETQKHKSKLRDTEQTRPISEMFGENRIQKFKNEVKSAEVKLVMALAEHNLPYSLMDHLPKLLKSGFPDSEIAKAVRCSHTKACYIMKDVIAAQENYDILKRLRGEKFSLIIDESTDVGDIQHVVVIARLFETHTARVMDTFVTLLEVEDGTSLGLFKTVKNFIQEKNVPITNIIGFASDNCSVMMETVGGFVTLLKKEIPDLYYIGCICHSFQLCSSKASEQLPYDLERLVKNICNYVSGSPKRLRELHEFQDFTDSKHLKILKLCKTRWLSHEAVVSRILNQWNPLVLYFQDQALSGGNKDAKGIVTAMDDPAFKAYVYFLNFILPTVKKLNLLFQRENPCIHHLLNSVAKQYKSVCQNFLKKEYLQNKSPGDIEVDKEEYFCPLHQLYLGARFEVLEQKGELSNVSKISVQIKCRAYMITLCLEIKKIINFKDPVLQAIVALDPMKALSGDLSSVVMLAGFFPQLVQDKDLEKLNEEWRTLPLFRSNLNQYLAPPQSPDPVKFWVGVQSEMNPETQKPLFDLLPKFMLQLLVLPHSSACAERVFSLMNSVKSKHRNRLQTENLNAILSAKEYIRRQGKECFDFQPSNEILQRCASDNVQGK